MRGSGLKTQAIMIILFNTNLGITDCTGTLSKSESGLLVSAEDQWKERHEISKLAKYESVMSEAS